MYFALGSSLFRSLRYCTRRRSATIVHRRTGLRLYGVGTFDAVEKKTAVAELATSKIRVYVQSH
jgi:hypothetical protein